MKRDTLVLQVWDWAWGQGSQRAVVPVMMMMMDFYSSPDVIRALSNASFKQVM
jgi:hypothetical protein